MVMTQPLSQVRHLERAVLERIEEVVNAGYNHGNRIGAIKGHLADYHAELDRRAKVALDYQGGNDRRKVARFEHILEVSEEK